MFPFTPSYLKHGRQFIKDARKLVAYKRDLVSDDILLDVEREISHLEHAVEKKDRAQINEQMQRLDQACGKLTKPSEDAAWRENVEVFLVAIVIALAVRTYFLQPFTIPTGSMQPTLNGIIVTKDGPPPSVGRQILEQAVFGRRYIQVLAKEDESILTINEVKRFFFFTYSELHSSKDNVYLVHATAKQMGTDPRNSFDVQTPAGIQEGRADRAGVHRHRRPCLRRQVQLPFHPPETRPGLRLQHERHRGDHAERHAFVLLHQAARRPAE